MVRHPLFVFINYNWINQLSNTTIWWLDIFCLLHRYQLHVSALMAKFITLPNQHTRDLIPPSNPNPPPPYTRRMPKYSCLQVLLSIYQPEDDHKSRNM